MQVAAYLSLPPGAVSTVEGDRAPMSAQETRGEDPLVLLAPLRCIA